uniref:Uncharacterized protein n=1 Tax=Parascaris univalens TaxID=6257 RepID=A0A914ZIP2_PARUN
MANHRSLRDYRSKFQFTLILISSTHAIRKRNQASTPPAEALRRMTETRMILTMLKPMMQRLSDELCFLLLASLKTLHKWGALSICSQVRCHSLSDSFICLHRNMFYKSCN